EHGAELADVARNDAQVALHAGPARDDERVPVAEARAEHRELDSARENSTLLAQVSHGVLRELLERLRHAAPLLRERARDLVGAEHATGCEAVAVAKDAAAPDRDELTLVDGIEELLSVDVDELNAAAHEQERPRVGEPSGLRRRAVDDDPGARVEQLLGRDA